MKSTINKNSQGTSQSYPCLKYFTANDVVSEDISFVVLFFKERVGTIVWISSNYDNLYNRYILGSYSSDWDESKAFPFNDSITLSNQ